MYDQPPLVLICSNGLSSVINFICDSRSFSNWSSNFNCSSRIASEVCLICSVISILAPLELLLKDDKCHSRKPRCQKESYNPVKSVFIKSPLRLFILPSVRLFPSFIFIPSCEDISLSLIPNPINDFSRATILSVAKSIFVSEILYPGITNYQLLIQFTVELFKTVILKPNCSGLSVFF